MAEVRAPGRPRWNGELCEARLVRVVVADSPDTPAYWARPYVGQEREAVEVVYQGATFYLDNEAHTPDGAEADALVRHGFPLESVAAGEGWRKVTLGWGSWRWPHRSLTVERVVGPA